ncbi:MAG: branched-chain-amino-acid transaminase [Euryarchaeota archaeon]|nr:branched-chain-amino-acid transaminase [Euryarchaeota archaeon]
MPELKAYFNGRFVAESEARISVFDHGFLYGDGVFEGIRAYNGRVFKLEEHIARLYDSAKAIALQIPLTREEMAEKILETLRLNNLRDAYIRPVVSRGIGDLGLDPRKCATPTVLVVVKPLIDLYGDKYAKGLTVITAATRRNSPAALSPNIKSLNYLNQILARIEANLRNADEALMLDLQGFVSEASADNIFTVKDGAVITPPTYNSLKGITRQAVIEVAEKEGFTIKEEPITLFDVYSADEIFITGTAAELAPVVIVDGRTIGSGRPGRITTTLMAAFKRFAQSHGTPIFETDSEQAQAKVRR